MRHLILFLIMAPFLGFSQVDFQNPPWNIDCDSSYTQASMNRCSAQKATIADSIMLDLYLKNLEYYKNEISRVDETPESDYPLEDEFKLSFENLKLSQEKFIEYRKSACEFESSKWGGGSITPLMVSMRYLSLTVDRLKLLESEYLFNRNK